MGSSIDAIRSLGKTNWSSCNEIVEWCHDHGVLYLNTSVEEWDPYGDAQSRPPLERTLFACDELAGFIHACGLVRPTGLVGLEPKSVRKKLKTPAFAAGVSRDDVYAGPELLGIELDDHIRNVVAALLPISAELGLPTS